MFISCPGASACKRQLAHLSRVNPHPLSSAFLDGLLHGRAVSQDPFVTFMLDPSWVAAPGIMHVFCSDVFFVSNSHRCLKGTSLLPGGQVVQVAGGGMHSAALTASGEVYTTGVNDEGALGRETSSRPLNDLNHRDKACGNPAWLSQKGYNISCNGHEVRVLCMHHQHRVQLTV